jgi:hypothetical protein
MRATPLNACRLGPLAHGNGGAKPAAGRLSEDSTRRPKFQNGTKSPWGLHGIWGAPGALGMVLKLVPRRPDEILPSRHLLKGPASAGKTPRGYAVMLNEETADKLGKAELGCTPEGQGRGDPTPRPVLGLLSHFGKGGTEVALEG